MTGAGTIACTVFAYFVVKRWKRHVGGSKSPGSFRLESALVATMLSVAYWILLAVVIVKAAIGIPTPPFPI